MHAAHPVGDDGVTLWKSAVWQTKVSAFSRSPSSRRIHVDVCASGRCASPVGVLAVRSWEQRRSRERDVVSIER